MTFSVFAVLMIVIVALVAFFHMLQGFFSAAISAVLAIFSAVLALSYHEVIVEKFLGGRLADSAHAMVLLVLFAAIYLVLRTVFDSLVPGNIRLPSLADRIGGAALGAVAGIFGAGVVAVAAQEMSFFPSMMGYARYEVDSHDATVPGARRSQDTSVTDQMTAPEFDDGHLQKMLLPVDDILVDTTKRLSEGGALSAEPLTRMHPDWLQELFAQRIGIEPGARRVLLALPNTKAPEARTDGVYLITEPTLPWIDAEFAEVRGQTKQTVSKAPAAPEKAAPGAGPPKLPPEFYSAKPRDVLLVIRVRFNRDAAERNAGGFVRVSPGSVRLVTPTDGKNEAGGYENHYPVGTLEYRDYRAEKGHPKLPRFVMMGQNVDDFIFVATEPDENESDSNSAAAAADGGVDFVYEIPQKELGWALPLIAQTQQINLKGLDVAGSNLKLPPGSFIEVKRLAREDLSGKKVQPQADLYKGWESIRVLRKPEEMRRGLESHAFAQSADTGSDTTAGGAVTPSTPAAPAAPNPSAPAAPAPAQASANFPLDVADDAGKVSSRFFTGIGTNGAEGTATIASGSFTLVKPEKELLIQSARVDGAAPAALRSGGATSVINLAAPMGSVLVQVEATPKGGAADKTWAWKDQLTSLSLVDADNTSYPINGVWVSYADPADTTTRISARYSADNSVPLTDLKPGGEAKQIWLTFPVKPGAKIKRLVQGSQVIKDLTIDVP